jgi:DNA sulfur modification protein DndC
MNAMIQNDEDKKWMIPLADFREKKLNTTDDFPNRDFRRLDKSLTSFQRKDGPSLIHGPYKQHYREELLLELLEAQTKIRSDAIEGMELFELITFEELEEIRRIWIEEKHEIEDSLPRIYKKATGEKYPSQSIDEGQIFKSEDLEILKEICKSIDDPDDIHYQMLREMLHVEQGYRGAYRRNGIFETLEKTVRQHAFLNKEDALAFKLTQANSGSNEVTLEELSDSDITNGTLQITKLL